MKKVIFYLTVLILLFSSPAFAEKKTIGVILTGNISYYRDAHNAFIAKLEKEGYINTVEIIVQKPYPDFVSLGNAVRKLAAFDADVIVTYGGEATKASIREKTGIPIVYTCVYEPCSLSKSRNITGICSKAFVSSLLRYLRSLTTISTLGAIYSSSEEASLQQMKELSRLSAQYGFKIEDINIRKPQDVMQNLHSKKLDAIFITDSAMTNMAFPLIIEFAREKKIPTASFILDKNFYATVVLSPAAKEQGEKTAEKVINILKGVSPDKITASISTDTDLIFNLKEARLMGFKIPIELITEATRLIQ